MSLVGVLEAAEVVEYVELLGRSSAASMVPALSRPFSRYKDSRRASISRFERLRRSCFLNCVRAETDLGHDGGNTPGTRIHVADELFLSGARRRQVFLL